MPDPLTPSQRHRCMSRIRSRNTRPELVVRHWLWQHGYRYRLNVRSVPGKADIVLRRYRTAIFVNGCFWHGHEGCCRIPKTNTEFWLQKIQRNQQRDQRNYEELQQAGWQVLVLWECELKPARLEQTMQQVSLRLNRYYLRFTGARPLKAYPLDEDYELPMAACLFVNKVDSKSLLYGEKS